MDLNDAQDRTTVLQSKLYQAARSNPQRRFHQLYDKLFREDVLWSAWYQVKGNRGAPGIDGVSIAAIDASGAAQYLEDLGRQLRQQEYTPSSVRRVEIPKSNGKVRQLGIPTVRDRIVQAAAKLILEPIFEADFKPTSFGFRPGIGQPEALASVHKSAQDGYQFVVDADIEGFFDNLDHERLMVALRRRVSDGSVLRLIYRWLKIGVYVGLVFSDSDQGTPQGGVISPLLANIYLHALDVAFSDPTKGFIGRLTRFADDLIIQCGTRQHAERALKWLASALDEHGLRLSAAKTAIVKDGLEGFDFLGFHHRRAPARPGKGKASCNLRWPSNRSAQKFRDHIKELLARCGRIKVASEWRELQAELNRYIRGWGSYFRNSQGLHVFEELDWYVQERVARYLARCQPTGKRRKPRKWQSYADWLAGRRGILRLSSSEGWSPNPYRGVANVRWKAV